MLKGRLGVVNSDKQSDVVDGHLFARLVIAALFVEWHVLVATVKNDLVAAPDLCELCEHLDDALAEPLSLSVLVHNDVLDVATQPCVAQELELDEERAARYDLIGGDVEKDNGVVCVGRGELERKLLGPRGEANVRCLGEIGKDAQMAAMVVVTSQRTHRNVVGKEVFDRLRY